MYYIHKQGWTRQGKDKQYRGKSQRIHSLWSSALRMQRSGSHHCSIRRCSRSIRSPPVHTSNDLYNDVCLVCASLLKAMWVLQDHSFLAHLAWQTSYLYRANQPSHSVHPVSALFSLWHARPNSFFICAEDVRLIWLMFCCSGLIALVLLLFPPRQAMWWSHMSSMATWWRFRTHSLNKSLHLSQNREILHFPPQFR